ncbi:MULTISPECIES: STAS domain-containing protein [Streptomyces]|uniref:STAS domain-containing protein n=1 Tax=Streptomyces lichenis TaxID=2306967 RepID=A0ABT0I9T6_9ACTN|nr:STAS domain-containing protein [Streptomyces lichenis]MCK8678097.1 STAS domain-containing protein [Streptomyces lichenis]
MTTTPISLTVISRGNGTTALALSGELDLDTSARIEPELSLVARQTDERLLVDLSGVTFCDTSGAELFLRLRRRRACEGERRGELRLCRVPKQTGRVFRILGVDQAIPCSFG